MMLDAFFENGHRSDLGSPSDGTARLRYALVVSIETKATDVNIWTPVGQEVGISSGEQEVQVSTGAV